MTVDLNKPAFQVFPEAAQRIKRGKCAVCGQVVHTDEFRDQLSIREFSISGMCQSCQDSIFGTD